MGICDFQSKEFSFYLLLSSPGSHFSSMWLISKDTRAPKANLAAVCARNLWTMSMDPYGKSRVLNFTTYCTRHAILLTMKSLLEADDGIEVWIPAY